jgi:hypothetical protein
LVWLPEELISQETGASPAAPRRAETGLAETVPPGSGASGLVLDPARWASPAPATVPAPAPAGGLPLGGGEAAVPEPVAASAAAPYVSSPPADVILPPAPAPSADNKLPIFESVESDWFRRGRRGLGLPAPAAALAPGGWASPGDEGWRAAQVASVPVTGGMTVSGLPKRLPRANLVPGGVEVAPPPAEPVPARSPSLARDRLASFQRGIQEGRAAAREDDTPPGDPLTAPGETPRP